MISKLIKLPLLKRIIPSLSIRILKLLKKNRGYFKINNFEMFLDFLDPIDREIILHQEFESTEIDYLLKQISKYKIDYFLDVGANCGYYSIKISKKISNIKVLAFEPNIEAYSKFLKSIEKNPDISKKIELKKYGLSDRSAEMKMQSMIKFGYAQTGGASIVNKNEMNKSFTFPADFKIGDECINIIDKKIIMKIDVEGHELNVLKGVEKVIKKNKCIIQVEAFKNNYQSVNNFLILAGYKKVYEVVDRSNFFYNNFI